MLRVTHGERYTRFSILTYTNILAAICLMPFASGMSGWMIAVKAMRDTTRGLP